MDTTWSYLPSPTYRLMKNFCNFYNRIDRVYLKSSDKYINRRIEGSRLNRRFMCRRILFNSRLAIWFVFVPICSRERDKLAHRGDCWCQYRDSGMTSYGESKSRKDVKEWRRVMGPLGMPRIAFHASDRKPVSCLCLEILRFACAQ